MNGDLASLNCRIDMAGAWIKLRQPIRAAVIRGPDRVGIPKECPKVSHCVPFAHVRSGLKYQFGDTTAGFLPFGGPVARPFPMLDT